MPVKDNKVGAFFGGVMQLPLDAIKYPALLANAGRSTLEDLAGWGDPKEQEFRKQAIINQMDNTPFLPDAFAQYRRAIMDKHPNYALAGEISAGVPAAFKALAKRKLMTKATKLGTASTVASANETIKEPLLDSAFTTNNTTAFSQERRNTDEEIAALKKRLSLEQLRFR